MRFSAARHSLRTSNSLSTLPVMYASDFNQDGFPDLASISASSYSVSPLALLLNTGK
jgi:hypothetical protein